MSLRHRAKKIRGICCILVLCCAFSGCASYTLFKSKKDKPGEAYETVFNVRGPEASIEHSF